MADGRGKRSDDSGQTIEDRMQRTDIRGQKTEVGDFGIWKLGTRNRKYSNV